MAETDAEHHVDDTEESKSLLLGHKRNRIDSIMSARRNSQLSGAANDRLAVTNGNQIMAEPARTNPSNEQDNETEPATAESVGVWKQISPPT